MLGAASEKAVYLLADTIRASKTVPAEQAQLREAIEKRSLPMMFQRIAESIEQAKKSGAMPYAVHEGADRHLLSLQEGIRVQRNDAVHPQAGRASPEAVLLAIASFPFACKKIYDLMEWFKNNKC
jgi:hypothetical protein